MAGGYSLGVAQGAIVVTYDGAGVAQAEAGLASVQKKSLATTATLDSTSKKMAKSGAIIAGGLALAVKQASDFEQKLNVLVTAAGESPKALGMVGDGIKQIALQTGDSLDNLVEGMYILEKAGLRGANGLTVLQAAAQGAREEGVPLETMTGALTSIMQSYGLKAEDAVQATNALKTGAGLAKTTMQEFAGSLATVLPLASTAGISFPQVAGAIDTLTQHGTSAREATQELANTIRNLQAPNNVAVRAMQQLGLSSVDVQKNLGKRGLQGTIELLSNAITSHMGKDGLVIVNAMRQSQSATQDLQVMLGKMPPELKKLSEGYLNGTVSMKNYRQGFRDLGGQAAVMGNQFYGLVNKSQGFNDLIKSGNPAAQTYVQTLKRMVGGATGLNTVLQLTGASQAYFTDATNRVSNSMNDASKEVEGWSRTEETAAVQTAKLKAAGEVLAVNLGNAVMPAVMGIVHAITAAVSWFSNLSPTMQKVIGDGLLFTSIFLLGGSAILKLTSTTIKLVSAIGKTGGALIKGGKSIATFIGGMRQAELSTSRMSSAAYSFGNKVGTGLSKVRDGAVYLVNSFKTLGARIATMVTGNAAATASEEALARAQQQNIIAGTERALATQGIVAANTEEAASAEAAAVATGELDAAMDANPIGAIIVALIALAAAIYEVIKHWDAIKKAMIAVWDAIKTGVMDAINFVKKHWQLIAEILLAPFAPILALVIRFWPQVKSAFSTGINAIVSFVKAVWGGIEHYIIDPVVNAWNAVVGAFTTAYNDTVAVISTIIGWISDHWKLLVLIFLGPLGAVIDMVTTHWAAIQNFIVTVMTAIWNFLVMIWNAIYTAIATVVNIIVAFFTLEWNILLTVVETIFNAILAVITTIWNAIRAVGEAVWGVISAALEAEWNGIKAIATTVFNAIKAVVTAIWNGIKSVTSSVWGAISGVVGGIANTIKSVVTTAFNGIRSVADSVWHGISSVISGVYNSTIHPIINGIKTVIDGVKTAMTELKNMWDTAWSALASGVSSVWNGTLGSVLKAVKSILGTIEGLVSKVSGAIGKVAHGVGSVVGKVGGFLGLDTGGWVPGRPGQLAGNVRVHGGEYVLSTEMIEGRQQVDPAVLAALSEGQINAITRNMRTNNHTQAPASVSSGLGGVNVGVGAPTVHVYIGNEEIDGHIKVVVGDTLSPLTTMVNMGGL